MLFSFSHFSHSKEKHLGTCWDCIILYPNSLSYLVILPAVWPCFFYVVRFPLEEPHRATGNDGHEAIGRAIVGAARTEQGRNLFRRDGVAVGSTGSTVKYAEVSIVTGVPQYRWMVSLFIGKSYLYMDWKIIEICGVPQCGGVHFPFHSIYKWGIFHSYVGLPEGMEVSIVLAGYPNSCIVSLLENPMKMI